MIETCVIEKIFPLKTFEREGKKPLVKRELILRYGERVNARFKAELREDKVSFIDMLDLKVGDEVEVEFYIQYSQKGKKHYNNVTISQIMLT